jgi:GT2 family glycosyltransferase
LTGTAVDVVILTWNDGDLLQAAVDSVARSDNFDGNVIVVDNGSDPPADVDAAARIRIVRNDDNKGVAPGRNQGVAESTAEFVCFLDSDARLEPDTLGRLLEPLVADERVGLAAPVFVDQAPEASAGRAPNALRKVARGLNLRDTYAGVARGNDRWWKVDFAIGACQLFRRAAFDAVGGLDESIFYGPEDVDFCLRLGAAGWSVVQVADARVHHPARRRFRGLFTRRGMAHALAIGRHLWRHRRSTSRP